MSRGDLGHRDIDVEHRRRRNRGANASRLKALKFVERPKQAALECGFIPPESGEPVTTPPVPSEPPADPAVVPLVVVLTCPLSR